MRHTPILILIAACRILAQPVIAPSPETVGPSRGRNAGDYNLVNSFETGYRFHSAGGNLGKYRSDVNFGNGLRLLGSNLTIHSREGHGRYFDELVLNTQGLGNDPYQFANLRIQKNKLYRYDLLWRWNEYFNPALTVTQGSHLMDTTRTLQDHDLTLFPQSRFRILAGYSRNRQAGPALTTTQLFDSRGDEFPLFADVNRQNHEFRLGGQAELGGARLTVVHAWDSYREDYPQDLEGSSPGANTGDRTALASLRRTEPYRGNSPWWRGNLVYDRGKWFAVNGRMTYVSGARHFAFSESAIGTDRLGAARNRQILVGGNASRPAAAGFLTLSLFPTDRLTVTNHTAAHHTRMAGNSVYQEFDNATAFGDLINYQFLGIRMVSNLTDANYRLTKWASLYGGFHYSSRRIRSIEHSDSEPPASQTPVEQYNRLRAGLAGFRLQPVKALRISFDSEMGRADRPFTPISEKNYHALGARIQWRAKTLTLAASARTNYNFNSVSLAVHSSRSRNYSFDASWNPARKFGVDAGYAKLHLDTLSGLAYFAAFQLVEGDRSLYISNIHTSHLGARISPLPRVDFFLGYHLVQDTGDGRASAGQGPALAGLPAFLAAQTFPLHFQSPSARVSVRLLERLRWNFGYQHYNYAERFLTRQNYRAHTGYTSLTWAF